MYCKNAVTCNYFTVLYCKYNMFTNYYSKLHSEFLQWSYASIKNTIKYTTQRLLSWTLLSWELVNRRKDERRTFKGVRVDAASLIIQL